MKTYCRAREAKSRSSRSTWSGVNAIQLTTASNVVFPSAASTAASSA